jgi:V/A-type H+-transporting ATPase subunit I
VIARLHEAGAVQLKEITEPEVARKKIDEELSDLSPLISKFSEMEDILGRPTSKPTVVKERTFEQTTSDAKKSLKRLEPKIGGLKEKREGIELERQSLLAQLELANKFGGLGVPLQYLRSTDEIKVTIGSTDEEKAEKFLEAVQEPMGGKVFASAVGSGDKKILIVVCRAKDYQKLSPIIYRFEVELFDAPSFSGMPSAAVEKLKTELSRLEEGERRLAQVVKRLGKEAREVSKVKELLEIQRQRLEAARLFGYTDSTVVIEGWVREKRVPRLEKMLSSVTKGHSIFHAHDPSKEEIESVPIELENPKVVEDFEYVTGMYGLAKYDEIDPTPFLSVTFALFFGIALADVGYGLALGLFMGSGVWLAKIFSPKLRRMMVVCAVFTIIMGLLMGGFFGFGRGLWINPVEQPVPLLKLVIFIGIFHLIMAYGLAGALKDIFKKDWKTLVYSRLSAVLMLIGFFGLCFSVLGIGLHEFGINYAFPKTELFAAFNPIDPAGVVVMLSRMLFYSGMMIGVAGAVLVAKDVKGKIGGPLNILYGVIGFIADVSSYTRLMALCIAGGVIAFSINLILGMVFNGIMPTQLNPLSAIFAVLLVVGFSLIFIIVHSFNIFINSLGCFIHTMRLHFSEFFGKFYESGGEKFVPFKAKRKFTKVKGGELVW